MRWLVTGAHGQLGTHLVAQLAAAGAGDEVIALGRADLDVTDAAAVDAAVRAASPDVVVNAAAYTAVDAAETDEELAFQVNATAVEYLGQAAERVGARLVQVSTDYVFSGLAERPYEPTDPTGPPSAYGRSKLAGERAAQAHGGQVVRTAWVYGGPGANFVDTMLRLAAERPTVDVVSDQIGSPTYVADLAAGLIELGRSGIAPRVLHYANAGQASWYDLARAVFAGAGHDPERVRAVDSAQFVRPAPRPSWSVLSSDAWTASGLTAPPSWTDALSRCLAAAATAARLHSSEPRPVDAV
jgi:dTDP-4-dehydrorhamnose reductase